MTTAVLAVIVLALLWRVIRLEAVVRQLPGYHTRELLNQGRPR